MAAPKPLRKASPAHMAQIQRAVFEGVLTSQKCRELIFIHKSCGVIGYRPHVISCTPHDLIASNSAALVLPLLNAAGRIQTLVENRFGRECELFIEFVGLISWKAGASIGWHSDSNRDYLTQRHFSAVCYLNDQDVDFTGGTFRFQNELPDSVTPAAGRVVAYSSGEENTHSVDPVTGGERITLALWFTADPDHSADKSLLPQLQSALQRALGSLPGGAFFTCAPHPVDPPETFFMEPEAWGGEMVPKPHDSRLRESGVGVQPDWGRVATTEDVCSAEPNQDRGPGDADGVGGEAATASSGLQNIQGGRSGLPPSWGNPGEGGRGRGCLRRTELEGRLGDDELGSSDPDPIVGNLLECGTGPDTESGVSLKVPPNLEAGLEAVCVASQERLPPAIASAECPPNTPCECGKRLSLGRREGPVQGSGNVAKKPRVGHGSEVQNGHLGAESSLEGVSDSGRVSGISDGRSSDRGKDLRCQRLKDLGLRFVNDTDHRKTHSSARCDGTLPSGLEVGLRAASKATQRKSSMYSQRSSEWVKEDRQRDDEDEGRWVVELGDGECAVRLQWLDGKAFGADFRSKLHALQVLYYFVECVAAPQRAGTDHSASSRANHHIVIAVGDETRASIEQQLEGVLKSMGRLEAKELEWLLQTRSSEASRAWEAYTCSKWRQLQESVKEWAAFGVFNGDCSREGGGISSWHTQIQ